MENFIFDIVIAAIIVLYFLFGFFKGFTKPLISIISWGVIFALIYFVGKPLGNMLMIEVGLEQPIREILAKIIEDGALINTICKYVGVVIASIGIFLIVKILAMVINIIIKKARKAHRKTALDRILGCILGIIKGAVVVCVIMAILVPLIDIIKVPELTNMINNSYVTKYIVEYNPITMLFEHIVTKV
ncbi:MAG: CvpA family protein [Clostridia bacterium]|nr:CvpA family protein [Clostridia bacterium]